MLSLTFKIACKESTIHLLPSSVICIALSQMLNICLKNILYGGISKATFKRSCKPFTCCKYFLSNISSAAGWRWFLDECSFYQVKTNNLKSSHWRRSRYWEDHFPSKFVQYMKKTKHLTVSYLWHISVKQDYINEKRRFKQGHFVFRQL